LKTDTLTDRLDAAAKAKQALLERAKAKDPTKDPEFAARQEARAAAARAREEREAERRLAKRAEQEREVAERKARKEAAIKAEADRILREQADGLAAQKAALMARFGTRKKK
jgi:hypothetical protein